MGDNYVFSNGLEGKIRFRVSLTIQALIISKQMVWREKLGLGLG